MDLANIFSSMELLLMELLGLLLAVKQASKIGIGQLIRAPLLLGPQL